jgi:hypothetical protein
MMYRDPHDFIHQIELQGVLKRIRAVIDPYAMDAGRIIRCAECLHRFRLMYFDD